MSEEGPSTLRGALSRLADSLVGLARTRLELATVEYTEEREHLIRQLMLVLAGVTCLMFALLFVALAVIALLWDTYRMAAFIGVIVFFAGGGAILLWRRAELASTAPTPFGATIAEFDKDRSSIARTMNLPPS